MKDFTDAYREELRKIQPSPEFLENMKQAIPAAVEARPEDRLPTMRVLSVRSLHTKIIAVAACLVLLAGVGFFALTSFRIGIPLGSENAYAGELRLKDAYVHVVANSQLSIEQPDFLRDSDSSLFVFEADLTCFGIRGNTIQYRIDGDGAYLTEKWSNQWSKEFSVSAGDSVYGFIGVELRISDDLLAGVVESASPDASWAKVFYQAIRKLDGSSLVISCFQDNKLIRSTTYYFESQVEDWQDVRSIVNSGGAAINLVERG